MSLIKLELFTYSKSFLENGHISYISLRTRNVIGETNRFIHTQLLSSWFWYNGGNRITRELGDFEITVKDRKDERVTN